VKLKHTLITAALGLMVAAPAAQAAIQSWSFSGTVDSGSLLGETYSGSFSFDDAALTGMDAEWLSVANLSMTFNGSAYTQADVTAGAAVEVGYQDGVFLGLAYYSVDSAANAFTFVAGNFDTSDAFFAYDNGAGNVIYASVPEPKDWMLLLAGIGLVGMMVERAKRRRV
jgi:hypothetical protein